MSLYVARTEAQIPRCVLTTAPRSATVLACMLWGASVGAEEPSAPVGVELPLPAEAATEMASPPPAAPTEVEALRRRIEMLERRLTEHASATMTPVAPPPIRAGLPELLRFQGYGDLQLALHDFGADQNRQGGAQRDLRLEFDTTRFVLELIVALPLDIEVETEIEFEHGGTGAAMELEYEEFGEFETEVEKGGEVLLEELFLTRTFADQLALKVGRFYVAIGQLTPHHRPIDYLAVSRSEAETTVLPAVWDEIGVQLSAWWPWLRATAQIVNGLDSTGFSSQRWVASGHQRRFELVRATDLAFVGRLDAFPAADTELGVSAYYGGTSRNRPKADLVKDCQRGDDASVAPCGYVDAPLVLADAHASFRLGPVRGTALALWGYLANAAAVSARNERLSNALQVPRTPVADQALAAWGEVGVDVAPWLGFAAEHALEPFARVDWYDTMFLPRAELFDNPRFERLVVTGGVSWLIARAVVVKLDASHRRFGTAEINTEETVRMSVGFVY